MEFSALYRGITISFLSAVLSVASFVPQQALAQKQPNTAQMPWMNKALSPDQRADMVVGQMTLDEKIQMVHGTGWGVLRAGAYVAPGSNLGAGYTEGVERLGIPGINMADSAVGIRMAALQSRYATLLPSTLGAASSWDTKAAFLYGSVIGREAWAQGFNMSIGGGLDITREPRNGRNFEYAGEDPVLAGIMTGELALGVKSEHVMSDIKHYALNDQETGRNVVNVLLDKRSMRESDLLAFEIAIALSKPSAVMCSYNLVNGDHACENDYLLNQVLKKDFDYKGFVVSDWGGTHSTVKAALNGLDQDEPGDDNYFSEPLKKAVEDGQVPMARLNDMVHRILRSMFDAGVIDNPPVRTVVDPFRGRDDAQHIAEESIVLLKNSNSILPLKAAASTSIAIIGSHTDVGVLSGGGSAQVDAPGGNAIDPKPGSSPWGQAIYFPSSPLRYIREKSPQSNVQYIDGKDTTAAAKLAKDSSLAIVFVTQPMREGQDAPTLSLPDNQDALVEAVAAANPNTIVVLETGGPVTMPWAAKVKGIVEMWYPGIGGAQALSNILFGDVNPSGKLPVTFARNDDQLPHPTVPGLDPNAKTTGDDGHHDVGPFDLKYTEGAKVGYKWFEATHKQPLFPFGFGLSYTTYAYSGLTVDDATRTARFTVKNTGSREGTEIAELYVALPSAADEHFKRLVGWERVKLTPGESKEVSIPLNPLYLSIFDTAKDAWQLLPGDYKVMAGASSSDTPLDATLHVQK
ncbi:MAG TPA: glycoside hydrolase family 3 C-terminal domain-containing protein [Edaphobacter sp.]|uniref:beta-glucosidase n=1 Tax=Edaphobacter sp. TaxID=1934404 RepID=UPI002BBC8138|nr:glycoside hydrolase family 3 C-terminal domain-containing protein [Edaphobacter sp.]HUZ94724.1 glycoside hydrolase family 3 C-terminal domain-containing protein [Edaphobacter sp.]